MSSLTIHNAFFMRIGETIKTTIMTMVAMLASVGFEACANNIDRPVEVSVNTISEELAAVRDYVPLYAVIAHRGSTYWAPEETESAWRWAREMSADYLESDLQCSKDGVIIANHDDNLKRTTNIEAVFGSDIPATRLEFYESLGFSHDDAEEQLMRDRASFQPYYMQSYYYAELLMLDAGGWFDKSFAASRNGSLADGQEQMRRYVGTDAGDIAADGCFTNRAEISLQYMIDNGFRCREDIPNPFYPGSTYDNSQASESVPDAVQTLERLGYHFTKK